MYQWTTTIHPILNDNQDHRRGRICISFKTPLNCRGKALCSVTSESSEYRRFNNVSSRNKTSVARIGWKVARSTRHML
jgi:hypothetical protein